MFAHDVERRDDVCKTRIRYDIFDVWIDGTRGVFVCFDVLWAYLSQYFGDIERGIASAVYRCIDACKDRRCEIDRRLYYDDRTDIGAAFRASLAAFDGASLQHATAIAPY